MVLEHNRRSTRPRLLRELLEVHHLEAVAVKQWGKRTESGLSTPPHRLQHPNRIHEEERLWFEECRNQVGRYDTTLR
jgi:hypothetical protein